MFAKVCFLVLAIGASACVLLTVRQQRLDAAHDMAIVQSRIVEHDRDLLRLRGDIAARMMPARIETLAMRLGPLAPIGIDPASPAARAATAIAANTITQPGTIASRNGARGVRR